jgi:hypothetical protein
MQEPTWKVSDLLLLVLSAGLAFGAFRYFWQPPPMWNLELFLSSYLALLAIASLGSFLGRPAVRRACQGYAGFGWLSLALVLRGGFGVTTNFQAEKFVQSAQMGMALGAICALVATWLLEPPQGPGPPAARVPGSDRGRDEDLNAA